MPETSFELTLEGCTHGLLIVVQALGGAQGSEVVAVYNYGDAPRRVLEATGRGDTLNKARGLEGLGVHHLP